MLVRYYGNYRIPIYEDGESGRCFLCSASVKMHLTTVLLSLVSTCALNVPETCLRCEPSTIASQFDTDEGN